MDLVRLVPYRPYGDPVLGYGPRFLAKGRTGTAPRVCISVMLHITSVGNPLLLLCFRVL